MGSRGIGRLDETGARSGPPTVDGVNGRVR
jgi:hypothetical protein